MLLAVGIGNNNLVTVLIENGADINTPAKDVRKSSVNKLRSFSMRMSHTHSISIFILRYVVVYYNNNLICILMTTRETLL